MSPRSPTAAILLQRAGTTGASVFASVLGDFTQTAQAATRLSADGTLGVGGRATIGRSAVDPRRQERLHHQASELLLNAARSSGTFASLRAAPNVFRRQPEVFRRTRDLDINRIDVANAVAA